MPQELPEGWKHTKINASDKLVPYVTIISTDIDGDDSDNAPPIGKQYEVDKDGSIIKKKAVNYNVLAARVVPCATPSEYLAIQKNLTAHEAIIMGVPSGAAPDEEFLIASKMALGKAVANAIDDPTGWWTPPAKSGETRRIVCRLKQQWLPSTIRLFDLDAPTGTPDKFMYPSFDGWLADMGRGIPELLNVEMLVTQSNTGRVMGDVTKLHVIYAVEESCDVDQLAEDILIRCWQHDLGWYRPREGSDSLMFTPIYDRAVMVGSQRIVYDGIPEVSKEIPFDPALKFIQVNVGGGPLGPVEVDTKARAAFCEGTGGTGGTGGGQYATVGIGWDEVWHTKEHGLLTLQQYIDGPLRGEHVICQIHQRGSTSWNGYFGVHDDGAVFVYDHGTQTKYMPTCRALGDTIGQLSKKALATLQRGFDKIRGRSKRAMPVPHGAGTMRDLAGFIDTYVLIGNTSEVADLDRPGAKAKLLGDFRNFHANNRVPGFTPSGVPKKIPMSELWLTDPNRKAVDAQDFDPNRSPLYVNFEGDTVFNTWRPIPMPSGGKGVARGGLADHFIKHLEHLIPDAEDRKFFLQFLAHTIQRPGERPAVVPVLTTFEKGTGRGYVKRVMDALLGDYSQTVSFTELLNSTFNPYMYKTLMLTCEEVHMSNSPAKRDLYSNKLRDLVTADRVMINIKNTSQFPAMCYVRLVLHTNHGDALSMDINERRFMVIQCALTKMPDADLLFDMLRNDPQFLRDMHAMLMDVSLADFNPHAPARVTEAMEQMVETSDSQQMQHIKDVISAWPRDIVKVEDIVKEARRGLEVADEYGITGNLVAAALKNIGAVYKRATWRDEENNVRSIRVWFIKNKAKWGVATGKKVVGYVEKEADKKGKKKKVIEFPGLGKD